MAEQEIKELSMAEILASIRKILEESGVEEGSRRQETAEEVFELKPSMIVREEQTADERPEILSAAPGRLMSKAQATAMVDDSAEDYVVGSNHPFASADEFALSKTNALSASESIGAQPQKTHQASVASGDKDNQAGEKPLSAEEPLLKNDMLPIEDTAQAESVADVSEEIISSFTRMFEQNDFRRRAEQPQFDADALLRGIIGQVVADKLDNRMLQSLVKETVVPVLEEWLSHYLPKLVAEEVKRVMIKTGRL